MSERLTARLEGWARTRPEAPAVIDVKGVLTYGELADRVRKRANESDVESAGWGVLPLSGDADSVVELLAAFRMGARPVLTDVAATSEELRRISAALTRETAAHGSRGARPGRAEYGLVTSGTGDLPKVIARDLEAAIDNCESYLSVVRYGADERVLCGVPIHHSYGFSAGPLSCLLSGACLVLPAGLSGSGLIAEASLHQCSVLISVPFLYAAALTSGRTAAPRVRLCVSAGDRLTPELTASWSARTGVALTNHYGSTECGFITVSEPGDARTVGRPVPGVDVRIADDEAGPDHAGPLRVGLPAGYSRVLGSDPPPADEDRTWIATGDIARIDRDGRVTLLGRASGEVTLAGRQISLAEVESVLREHPSVHDCVVIAVGDPVERLSAFVQAEPSLDELVLRRFLAGSLSSYKIPSRISILDQLPRTRTGKVRTGQLRMRDAESSRAER